MRLISCYLYSHQSGTDKPLVERMGFYFWSFSIQEGGTKVVWDSLSELIAADAYRLFVAREGILSHDLIATIAEQQADSLVVALASECVVYYIDVEI